MRKLIVRQLIAGAATGLVAFGSLNASIARADNAGVVRISDAAEKSSPADTDAEAAPIEPEAATESFDGYVEGPVYGPWGGYGGSPYSQYSSPLAVWTSRSGPGATAGTLPPSYGWSAPIRRPLQNKVPVVYRNYWPQKWYGTPGAFASQQRYPVTYVPVDTMQQGYYYQRVPSWQPRPDMIPPAPWPGHWHRRPYPPQFQVYSQYPASAGYPAVGIEEVVPEGEDAPEPAQDEPPQPKSGVEPAPEA